MQGRVGNRTAALIGFLLILAGACAPAAPPAPGGAATATGAAALASAAQPVVGGRVILGDASDSKTLQPVLSTDTSSSLVWGRIYDDLIDVDPGTGAPVGHLAEKWEVAPDNKSLTFTLRDGLKWSDGSAFNGEDFKFTAEAVMRSKRTVRKNIFQDIVGAKEYRDGQAESIAGISVDGNVITVQLATAYCPALTSIGGFGIIPKSVFGKYMDPKDASKNLDDAPENTAPPLAMGPFKFKEWVPNDHIMLVRNDNFYGGKPYLDEWVRKVYPDANAMTAAVKTGELDVAPIEAKDFDDVKANDSVQLYEYPNNGYTYIGWNELRGGKEFFQDKAVRQALTYGLDMDQVIQKILFGHGQKMLSHTPPTSWAFDPTGMNDYKYDAARAEQLLEGEGYTKGPDGIRQKNGQKLAFTLITNSGNKTREALIQIAAEQYKLIGVSVDPQTESFEALVERTDHSKDPVYGEKGGRDVDAWVSGWALGVDPDAFSIWHSDSINGSFNDTAYSNPDVDAALVDGRTKCAQADRKAAYKILDSRLNQDQPYNFGFSANSLLAVNKRVQGVSVGPYSRYAQWNIQKWSVKP
jgi:peptide/nickel transport system substrate-binding protein